MVIAFYKVDNSKGYERHSFDHMDKAEDIYNALNQLPEEEWRTYDLSTTSQSGMYPSLGDFVEDYNNQIIDGDGWFVIVLPEEKATSYALVKTIQGEGYAFGADDALPQVEILATSSSKEELQAKMKELLQSEEEYLEEGEDFLDIEELEVLHRTEDYVAYYDNRKNSSPLVSFQILEYD